MMLARSAARPRRKNSRRSDELKRCPPFLKWLRGRPCLLASKPGHACSSGGVRACHVDYAGDKGVSTKVSDRFAIPMCDAAHGEQHQIGWTAFEAKWGFRALDEAYELWRHWLERTPMGAAWKARDQ